MEREIAELIRKEQLIEPGERILVAVSGGPDSVCLLHLLHRLSTALDIQLGIAHINHGLRGMASDEEETFVRTLGQTLALPVFIHTEDVAATGRRLGMGFEAAARQVRYDFFEKTMKLEGYGKTALAHHMNDQVETILHRFIRGAGLNGLAGMRIRRDGRYIRPLLQTKRAAILQWLKDQGLDYRTDSSNESLAYTRNRIRLRLIPELETFNPEIIGTIAAMSRSLEWDRTYLETAAADAARDLIRREGDKVVIIKEAFRQSPAITSRLVFLAMEELKGSRLDLTAGQIADLLDLAAGQTGRRLDLRDVTAASHYGQLEFSLKQIPEPAEQYPAQRTVDITHLPVTVDFAPYRITFSRDLPAGPADAIDAGHLGERIILRRRRPHDRIRIPGMQGHKKVRRLFIDCKIHRELRDVLPLITDESGEILYIYPGICSESFSITPNTDKILYITVMENNNNDK